ncbi:MAG: hypothetical protein ACRD1E_03560 [Terriglobales bacterium]
MEYPLNLQRGLSLVAGLTAGASGLEVAYMHYRGSYSRRIMWTPILMSQSLLAAGLWGALHAEAASNILPAVSALTLADCGAGFFFHLRGISRKPGGFRLLINNVCQGPPPFAPLLFGMSAYIGILAARVNRAHPRTLARHCAIVTGLSALASGTEALYSHYLNNFQYKVQFAPLIVAPLLAVAAFLAPSERSRHLLPSASALAIATGAIGCGYHLRGVLRRPGGRKHLLYNIIYGPPLLAPLLFAGAGFLGLVAALLRRN